MTFQNDLAHEQLSKRKDKIGVLDILVSVHHDNEAIALGKPGGAGTKEIVQKGLARAYVEAACTTKTPKVLLIRRPSFLAETRPVGGNDASAMVGPAFK